MSWYVQTKGKVVGPLSANDLRRLAGEGRLAAAHLVSRSPDGPWTKAGSIQGLAFGEAGPRTAPAAADSRPAATAAAEPRAAAPPPAPARGRADAGARLPPPPPAIVVAPTPAAASGGGKGTLGVLALGLGAVVLTAGLALATLAIYLGWGRSRAPERPIEVTVGPDRPDGSRSAAAAAGPAANDVESVLKREKWQSRSGLSRGVAWQFTEGGTILIHDGGSVDESYRWDVLSRNEGARTIKIKFWKPGDNEHMEWTFAFGAAGEPAAVERFVYRGSRIHDSSDLTVYPVGEGAGAAVNPPAADSSVAAGDLPSSADGRRRVVEDAITNSIGMPFRLIPAGTFIMGDPDGPPSHRPHQVTLTKPFHLGVHEVTNAQWKAVMGTVPSHWQDDDRPVEQVSWDDAVEFCRKLSDVPAERKAGRVYRLPTEAEWESACRAGTTTRFFFGDDESQLGDYAWVEGNSGDQTHAVGTKKPNPWGLHDMYGNVYEWCSDWQVGEYYGDAPMTDPQGPSEGSVRSTRGGFFGGMAGLGFRGGSAYRHGNGPTTRDRVIGFRVALEAFEASPAEAGDR